MNPRAAPARHSGDPPRTAVRQGTSFAPSSSATAATFATPARIAAITGFVEGPTLSPDGQRLYYHQKVGDTFEICRVRRVATP